MASSAALIIWDINTLWEMAEEQRVDVPHITEVTERKDDVVLPTCVFHPFQEHFKQATVAETSKNGRRN